MLEEKKEVILDNINLTSKSLSVAIDTVILKDGEELSRKRHRRSFKSDELDELKEYAGLSDDSPEVVYLKSVWK